MSGLSLPSRRRLFHFSTSRKNYFSQFHARYILNTKRKILHLFIRIYDILRHFKFDGVQVPLLSLL